MFNREEFVNRVYTEAISVPPDPLACDEVTVRIGPAKDCDGIACNSVVVPEGASVLPPTAPHSHLVATGDQPYSTEIIAIPKSGRH